MYKIKEWNVFFIFNSTMERAKIVARCRYGGTGHWYQQIGNELLFNAR
jgi:hypothetical protein